MAATATEVSPGDLKTALLRAGLDPETLAAAGVVPSAVAGLVTEVREEMQAHPERVNAADLAYANARRTSDSLHRLVQSGRASAEDVSAYQSAAQSLVTATTERTGAISALRTAGTEGIAATPVQRIARHPGQSPLASPDRIPRS